MEKESYYDILTSTLRTYIKNISDFFGYSIEVAEMGNVLLMNLNYLFGLFTTMKSEKDVKVEATSFSLNSVFSSIAGSFFVNTLKIFSKEVRDSVFFVGKKVLSFFTFIEEFFTCAFAIMIFNLANPNNKQNIASKTYLKSMVEMFMQNRK